MKKVNNHPRISISIIIPVYNVATIIDKVLMSIVTQTHPIKEIILIDNHSTDNSVKKIENFIATNKNKRMKLIKRSRMYGISSSYNLGAKKARSEYIVTLHSDSMLPTVHELDRLVAPIYENSNVIATYPYLVHKKSIWNSYNFWQKAQFARSVGTSAPSMNGKFDCYNKKIFLSIHGYDEDNFDSEIGAEDADMQIRLRKIGKIVLSKAKVIHLHGLSKNYSLKDWIMNRKFLSMSYGNYIKRYFNEIGGGLIYFLIKPLLVLSLFLIYLSPAFAIPFILFPIVYLRKMFTSRTTLLNPRIFFLPFIVYFLVFAESYWMARGFMRGKIK